MADIPQGHEHVFLSSDHSESERRTWIVVGLTTVMMVGEIIAGSMFGSLALIADGWHMATHAGALAIAALAYRYATRHARDPRFAFGTGKLGDLAGFSSAIVLGIIALLIAWQSLIRLSKPIAIHFNEAILVACLGLGVNLFCVWLLRHREHHHDHHQAAPHGHDHNDHDHGQLAEHAHPGGKDNNLRAAYLHVIADALTSVLAIVALLAGRFYGWLWMDPVIGIVGALVIARWSLGLMRDAGAVLVDVVPDRKLAASIRHRLSIGGNNVADLHLWQVGPGHNAAVVSVLSNNPEHPDRYKELLEGLPGLSHVTVEVQPRLVRQSAA